MWFDIAPALGSGSGFLSGLTESKFMRVGRGCRLCTEADFTPHHTTPLPTGAGEPKAQIVLFTDAIIVRTCVCLQQQQLHHQQRNANVGPTDYNAGRSDGGP